MIAKLEFEFVLHEIDVSRGNNNAALTDKIAAVYQCEILTRASVHLQMIDWTIKELDNSGYFTNRYDGLDLCERLADKFKGKATVSQQDGKNKVTWTHGNITD